AASGCTTAPTGRLPARAASIRRREDARPAPSGTTACGKTTVFRSGRMPRMSGTGRSFSFRTSVMRALSNNECLEEIDRLELAGGGPDERLARRPRGLVLHLHAALAQVRDQVFDLPLHLEHPAPHLSDDCDPGELQPQVGRHPAPTAAPRRAVAR